MTDEEKLKHISEYRFEYWREYPEDHPQAIYVRRSSVDKGRWAVYDGESWCWSGQGFSLGLRGSDAYRWSEDEALDLAQELALKKNDHIIGILERKFPGEFRGGPRDMSTKEQ